MREKMAKFFRLADSHFVELHSGWPNSFEFGLHLALEEVNRKARYEYVFGPPVKFIV